MNKKVSITAVLGIYNGERYLDSLFDQISNQTYKNFKLLIIDNHSTDQSFKIVSTWKREFGSDLVLVKNDRNLGGLGSLYRNLDKVHTKWFLTLHQDDLYKPNHIEILSEEISKSEQDVIGVSSTMGSIDSFGNILKSKPRSSWFAMNLDQPGQFLQNVRSQSVPYPASAFKLEIFNKSKVLIHSPTFSDTEQTLKMLAYGKFKYSKLETMYYRENPDSESQMLNTTEREMGAVISLTRIFNSREFIIIIDKLPNKVRGKFAEQLVKSIKSRVRNDQISNLLSITALECMLQHWGYDKGKEISPVLNKEYQKFSSGLTNEILSRLSYLPKKYRVMRSKQPASNKFTRRIWNYYFNCKSNFLNENHKIVLMIFYKVIFLFKKNHIFKNNWKM